MCVCVLACFGCVFNTVLIYYYILDVSESLHSPVIRVAYFIRWSGSN